MITLAIQREPAKAGWALVCLNVHPRFAGMSLGIVSRVPFSEFSSRPDPIQRAWDYLEAKWAMGGNGHGA